MATTRLSSTFRFVIFSQAAALLNAPLKLSEIFNNPREAYEKALRDHGPVIGVRRKGLVCEIYGAHRYL